MVLQVDLQEKHASQSASELSEFVRMLVGQPLLQVTVSYGDELCLHLGEPVPCSSPKMKGKVKGSYIIGTRASKWYFSSSDWLIVSDDKPVKQSKHVKRLKADQLKDLVSKKRGARVVSAEARLIKRSRTAPIGFGLFLGLQDGSALAIISVESAPGSRHIADWEIFTPSDKYLRAWPQARWEFAPSNIPEK